MSASEKLRALEARIGDGLVPYELEEALPFIAEVVEAADRLRSAALNVGMWGEPYHGYLATAVSAYEAAEAVLRAHLDGEA